MEILNADEFHKQYHNYAILNGYHQALIVEAWNAAIKSTQPKPVKWEPKRGGLAVLATGEIKEIGLLFEASKEPVVKFGMSRETQEQAEKARDDYRVMHLLHTWLTEQGWNGQIKVESLYCARGERPILVFNQSENLTSKLFNGISSGEIELSPKHDGE
jgi:hypothetical protein